MATKVGPKGHIVIEKRIRDELGVKPGWRAVQLVSDDRLIIRFLPPAETRSAFGMFREQARGIPPATPEQMEEALAEGLVEEFLESEARSDRAGLGAPQALKR